MCLNCNNLLPKNKSNSFACIKCGQYYSEESGAEEGFTCDDCNSHYELIYALESILSRLKFMDLHEHRLLYEM
jgi:transcription initiation factor IIE alpha subunit